MTERPSIDDVARDLGLRDDEIVPYGRLKAKVGRAASDRSLAGAKLALVSATNPTDAGEGKTTTAIALAMALERLGSRTIVALRQPSLGPIFGKKGGATGGGRATLVPSDEINVHFTGDIHAVGAAHNLLAAIVDNALHFRERFGGAEIDPASIGWGRVLDCEDRSLRHCVIGLGGPAHGVPREERFDITAASEVMAVLALARDRGDLEARLGRVVPCMTTAGAPVTAADLGVSKAMVALLRDAALPNLVQTCEGTPAFVHTGPFANIAHGCSSVVATRLALELGEWVVTEAGFGFDLGGEKFLDIKCRAADIWPQVVVVVTTLRSLAQHGTSHLDKHLESVAAFGLPAVVALNRFAGDDATAAAALEGELRARGVPFASTDGFGRGSEGALELARAVQAASRSTAPRFLYRLEDPPEHKALAIAQTAYGARDVVFSPRARADLARYRSIGGDALPLCIAKTQLSLSDDAHVLGRPRDFTITIREVRLAAGAGMLVGLAGDISTMPGLPREPHARNIHLDENGKISGVN